MNSIMSDHTTKAFDAELREITRMIDDMGDLTEKQITNSLNAMVNRDADLAQHAVSLDLKIDALQHEIEEKAIITIARRQPTAVDLRQIIGALRISNDLAVC
jgi:phosphate transport system protein